ncbi:PilZ domain-containing protein [PVC group bacterium]|nr:PilZ domain-containing protein [PVC group bacterium]
MSVNPENDRRQYVRIPYKHILNWKIFNQDESVEGSKDMYVKSGNLSVGGVVVTSLETFEPGSILGLRVSIPDQAEPLTIYAKVIRSEKNDQGMIETALKFQQMTEHDKSSIETLVREYSKK